MSRLLPNTTQFPNFYLDWVLPLLTPPETACLFYAVRRIFGFPGRPTEDYIPIPQFSEGLPGRDLGTGLKEGAARAAVHSLETLGILVRKSDGGRRGPLWTLELDDEKIDLDALRERKAKQDAVGLSRIEAARAVRYATPSVGQNPSCETEPVLSDRTPTGVVRQNRSCARPLADLETKRETKKICSTASRPASSDHQRLMAAYHEALGYPIRSGPREGAAAKALLAAGYSVEEVVACYHYYKAQEFYSDKDLSLQVILKQIGAWKTRPEAKGNGRAPRRETMDEEATRLATEAKEYRNARLNGVGSIPGIDDDVPRVSEPADHRR